MIARLGPEQRLEHVEHVRVVVEELTQQRRAGPEPCVQDDRVPGTLGEGTVVLGKGTPLEAARDK